MLLILLPYEDDLSEVYVYLSISYCQICIKLWKPKILLIFQLDSNTVTIGKAAIGNLLGGIGYFYGESKIALPNDINVIILLPSHNFVIAHIMSWKWNALPCNHPNHAG